MAVVVVVVAVLLVAGLVWAVISRRRVHRVVVMLAEPAEQVEDPGNPHVRHRRAVRLAGAAEPVPADPAVAALADRIRTGYKVGQDGWDALADGVFRELSGTGGIAAAVWVIERAGAGYRWEIDYWISDAGRSPGSTVRESIEALAGSWRRPNPFVSPSGYHPFIHQAAAIRVLTGQPRREAAAPLADLLECWFARAEHEELDVRDQQVLQAMVGCYRVTPTTAHPEFLRSLGAGRASTELHERQNKVSHTEGDITYVDPVWEKRGRLDLSALAREATGS